MQNNDDVNNVQPQVAFMQKKAKQHHGRVKGIKGIEPAHQESNGKCNQASKRALIPPDRLLVPAKTWNDQPLVSYKNDR